MVLAGLFIWLAAPAAVAAENTMDFDIPNKPVRIGMFPLEGYHDYQDGEITGGFGYEYMQHLRRYAPWSYEYCGQGRNWPDALGMLANRELDMLSNIRKTPEREARFAFSKYPVGESSAILTVKDGNTRFRSGDWRDWDGIRVGVLSEDYWANKFADYAQKHGFAFEPVYYNDVEKMTRDLHLGEGIDAVLSDSMRKLHHETIIAQLDSEPFYIAVRKGDQQLLEELDSAMSRLLMDFPMLKDRLRAKYYAHSQIEEEVVFTESELDFIQHARDSRHQFTAVLNPDRRPISYFENGENRGILKELADEMIHRSRLDIRLLPVQTPEEYRKACLDPAVDIIFDMPADFREAEKRGMLQSQSYISLNAAILKNYASGNRLKDIALVEHYRISDRIQPLLPTDAEIHYCKDTREAVDMVRSGKCDATCLHFAAVSAIMREDYRGDFDSYLFPALNIDLAVGVRDSRNPLLHSIICKSVASISDKYVSQVRLKYDPAQVQNYSFARFSHRYPSVVWGIPCAFLLLICGYLWISIRSRKKEYLLGTIFKKLPFRYFIADASGKLLQYNYGDAPETPFFRSLDEVPEESVREPIKAMVQKVMESGVSQEQFYSDSGRIRIAMISPLPKSLFGRNTVIGVSRDVTELRLSRDEAQKNAEYFRLTLRSIGDGVIATDQRGNIVMLNTVAEKMTGTRLADIAGKPHSNYFRMVDSVDGSPLESPILRALRTGMSVEAGKSADLLSIDGRNRYHIAESASPIHNDQGVVIGAILVFRDITEQYEHQRRAEQESADWGAVAEIAQIHHFKFDCKTRKVSGSPNISEVWPVKDGAACPAEEWVCKEDLPRWKREYQAIVNREKSQIIVDYRVRQGEKTRYFRGFMHTGLEKDIITGLVQEITPFEEAKQRHNALQNLLNTCINAMPIALFIKSATDDFRYIICNKKVAEQTFAMPVEKIIGHTDAELCMRQEDVERCRKFDLEVMSSGRTVELHESMQDKDGVLHYYRTVKTPAVDIDGKPVLLGMAIDETEDVKHAERIKELLDDWQNAAEIANIASYRLDSNMRLLSDIPWASRFWSVAPDGAVHPAEGYVHPDDVKSYNEMYDAVRTGRHQRGTMLCRVPQADGSMRYFRIFIQRCKNNQEQISGLIQDVTEQVVIQKEREALLSMWGQVIDSLPTIFFVKNADDNFRYLQANRIFYQTMHMSPEEIIGRTEEEFLPHRPDARQTREEDQKVMASGRSMDFIEHMKIDGIRHQYQTIKIPSVNEAGQRILIGMSHDITESQENSEIRTIISTALETLFTSDDLKSDLRIILKNVCNFVGFDRAYIACVDEPSNGIQILTTYRPDGEKPMFDLRNFRIEHASTLPWFIKMLGTVREEAVGFDLADADDYRMAKQHVPSILSKADEFDVRGVNVNYVLVNGKPWGSVGYITSGRPPKKLSENVKRLLMMIAHIVELAVSRRQTLEQLKTALNDALAADKAKSYFLSSMSHEIRTPLNAVIGFTDLLKDEYLDAPTRTEYLESVSSASQALLALLNDILDLSKLTSGKQKTHPVKTHMQAMADEMKSVFAAGARQKLLSLDFNIQKMPELYVDQPHLRQILFNLIGNAVKFTSAGGVVVTMSFEKSSEIFGKLTLRVADTGIGIVPEDREKMFEPFIQLSRMRGTNSAGNGTGLGLAIVKKIVEQEGGTLSLESEVGKGSVFTIVWPSVPIQPVGVVEKTIEIIAPEDIAMAESLSAAESKKRRVLVVDDSEIALNILCRMLNFMDVPYSKAASGEEALALLKKENFDMVVTDLLMPGMDGVALAKAIRAMKKYAKMRIVAMSTENESILYDRSLFDKVMLKPIVRNVLYNEVLGDGHDGK